MDVDFLPFCKFANGMQLKYLTNNRYLFLMKLPTNINFKTEVKQ